MLVCLVYFSNALAIVVGLYLYPHTPPHTTDIAQPTYLRAIDGAREGVSLCPPSVLYKSAVYREFSAPPPRAVGPRQLLVAGRREPPTEGVYTGWARWPDI